MTQGGLTGSEPPTVVLVHGAWHGGWCWQPVSELLRLRGITTIAVDLPGCGDDHAPLGDLYADAARVRGVLDQLATPSVVLGHSYGGAVITEATARHPNVAGLIYLAAFMPDAGESMLDIAPRILSEGSSLLPEALRVSGTTTSLDPDKVGEALYHDCSPELASWAAQRLGPHYESGRREPITAAGWREHVSYYVIAEQDRALPPTLQRELSARADTALAWPTSHSPFLAQPRLVANFVDEVARKLRTDIYAGREVPTDARHTNFT
jgi:pimeloyl-ACP methyl ester carboxylesterase